jgi:hypothetical protein
LTCYLQVTAVAVLAHRLGGSSPSHQSLVDLSADLRGSSREAVGGNTDGQLLQVERVVTSSRKRRRRPIAGADRRRSRPLVAGPDVGDVPNRARKLLEDGAGSDEAFDEVPPWHLLGDFAMLELRETDRIQARLQRIGADFG